MSLLPEDHYENAIAELKQCIHKLEIQAEHLRKRGKVRSYLAVRKQIFRAIEARRKLEIPSAIEPVLPRWIDQSSPRRKFVRS
jgi:hypothetical protein